jgi:hypothetical protein
MSRGFLLLIPRFKKKKNKESSPLSNEIHPWKIFCEVGKSDG